jgi:hypothetical protein
VKTEKLGIYNISVINSRHILMIDILLVTGEQSQCVPEPQDLGGGFLWHTSLVSIIDLSECLKVPSEPALAI